MRATSVLFALSLIAPLSATAGPIETFCRRVEKSVNTLADFTSTKCVPAAGKEKGTYSFILISERPVFSNESSKKAWLIVVCSAAGSELNKRGALRAHELWFTDVERIKQRIAFRTEAESCKALQFNVHDGEMSIEQMYAKLNSGLVKKEVSR